MSFGKVIVLTGGGKGKTTSALGRCLEGWVEGKKALVLQFIKYDKSYGELMAQENMDDSFQIRQTGLGFVINSDKYPLHLHQQYATKALDEALHEIRSNTFDIIVLDEINYAVHFNLLSEKQVVDVIDHKPANLTLILTGRYARDSIIDKSDEVYEFREIKHHASQGIIARPGIEY